MKNPLASAAIGSIVRWLLAGAATFFVDHGIWTQGEASSYVLGASLAIVSIGWSLVDKYRGRIKFLTALAMTPDTTEAEVKEHISSGGATPSVSTPVNIVPKLDK